MILPTKNFLLLVFLIVRSVLGQEYQAYDEYPEYQDYAGDYGEQDTLYRDYAQRQQEKAVGGGAGMGKILISSALSWAIGAKIHSGRVSKKLKTKFSKEQKQLYSQYYNDVYKLTEQNQELQNYVDKLTDTLRQTEAAHELEALQRDYEEFKQPDIDGDDRISRAEFNMYVKNYLANYPGLTEKDYPKFEDFDHDGDGYVSFQEYAQQMALQAQQAELEQLYSGTSSKKAEGLNALYQQTKKAESFDDVYGNYARRG